MVESVTNAVTGGETAPQSAIDLLKADHRKVETLFEKVKANEDGDNTETFNLIRRELIMHTHIEETIFYPYLLQNGDEELQKLTREAIEEHRQAKMFIEELSSMSGNRESFPAKLKVLIEDVEHHVQEEEGEMFPMVEDQFGEDKLNRLGAEMEAEKARAKGNAARSVSA
jgi:hemerythrin superfamily protein